MLKIAFDPIYCHPLPAGHRFPMAKYELIPEQLLHEGVVLPDHFFKPGVLNERYVLLTHDWAYWARLKEQSLSAKEIRRIGFPLTSQLVQREVCIVQGTIEASVFALSEGVAFNVAGGTHHAGSSWGEGFCLLNDQAVAAHYLLDKKLAKQILIIDLDVHQGNGTAEIFEKNEQVFTFSMHCEKNFPFRKERSDLDIGLDSGVGDEQYLETLADTLPSLIDRVQPDFIFYLAGVDVLATDKLGWLKLSRQACKQRDQLVFDHCKRSGIPVQVSMGGGYSSRIGDIVDAHCNTFKVALALFN